MRFRSSLALGISAAVAMSIGLPSAAHACTRILWNDNSLAVLASRSMDWIGSSKPMLTVLPRGMARNGGMFAGTTVVADNPRVALV